MCPSVHFYEEAILPGLVEGMEVAEVMSALAIRLQLANADRVRIKEYCDKPL